MATVGVRYEIRRLEKRAHLFKPSTGKQAAHFPPFAFTGGLGKLGHTELFVVADRVRRERVATPTAPPPLVDNLVDSRFLQVGRPCPTDPAPDCFPLRWLLFRLEKVVVEIVRIARVQDTISETTEAKRSGVIPSASTPPARSTNIWHFALDGNVANTTV